MPEWIFIPKEMNADADKLAREGANKVTTVNESPSVTPNVGTGCVICESVECKDMLTCSACSGKVHFACTALPNYQLAVFRKSQRKYTCERCVVNAGDIQSTEARKSFDDRVQMPIHRVSTSGNSADRENIENGEIKCIKEDIKSIRGSISTLESEIVRVVSQLCDENFKMKENVYEERLKAGEREKDSLSSQIQKCAKTESDLRSQLNNQKDKNNKLSAECERLRESVRRREEDTSERMNEKCALIASLQSNLETLRKENEKLKEERAVHDNEPVHISTQESVHTDIPLRNRFEPPQTPARSDPSENRRPNAVYFKGYREPLSTLYRMKFEWKGTTFHSVEQAFQFEKATRHRQYEVADEILQSKHAGIANKIGRTIPIHPYWHGEKEQLMMDLVSKSRVPRRITQKW